MGQVIQAADRFKQKNRTFYDCSKFITWDEYRGSKKTALTTTASDELNQAIIDIARAPIEEFLVNPDEPPPEVA